MGISFHAYFMHTSKNINGIKKSLEFCNSHHALAHIDPRVSKLQWLYTLILSNKAEFYWCIINCLELASSCILFNTTIKHLKKNPDSRITAILVKPGLLFIIFVKHRPVVVFFLIHTGCDLWAFLFQPFLTEGPLVPYVSVFLHCVMWSLLTVTCTWKDSGLWGEEKPCFKRVCSQLAFSHLALIGSDKCCIFSS